LSYCYFPVLSSKFLIKKIAFILILIATVVVVLWGIIEYWPKMQDIVETKPKLTSSKPTLNSEKVDIALLTERIQTAQLHEPTPEEIAEDKAFEAEQIEEAKRSLLDLDIEKRIEGLEQLTAYPSPQSEQLMLDILKKDMSDEMRASAADYLSYIEEPSLATQDALIQALNDSNEDVRNNALNTVQSYIYALDEDSASAKRIVDLLKKQARNEQLPADMRESIKEYLIDHFGN